MSSSASNGRVLRWLAPALFSLGALAGCADADFYFDRRDTISLHAGDAVASNIIVQTVDPWPRVAANRNIPGERRPHAGGRRTLSHRQDRSLAGTQHQFGRVRRPHRAAAKAHRLPQNNHATYRRAQARRPEELKY
jgi:hypothetical protein